MKQGEQGMAGVPDDHLGLPATPGVVGVLLGRRCAPNGEFDCTYHPLKRLTVRGGGVAVSDAAQQYALDDAPVEHCGGPFGTGRISSSS